LQAPDAKGVQLMAAQEAREMLLRTDGARVSDKTRMAASGSG